MGLIVPSPGCSIAKIEEKIPNYGENEGERGGGLGVGGGGHFVDPELIEYFQWLIYSLSAPFKSPDKSVHRIKHKKYYYTWVATFNSRLGWGPYRKLLWKELETW